MPSLSNELLNGEQLMAEFEKYVVRDCAGVGEPIALSRFKSRLKSVYFDGIEDEAGRDARFSSNYMRLNHTLKPLKLIFALPDGGGTAAALEGMRSYDEGLDWQAEQAALQFAQFNEQFGFFQESPESLALFKKLAEASRVMIVLFEQNNTPEDTMAYEYAYKLMALFGPVHVSDVEASFKSISSAAAKVMNTSVSQKGKPYHDVLLVQTELPDARALSQETRVGWQTLIRQHGELALKLFSKAAAIEIAFHDAPKTLKDAKSWAMQCQYKRAAEDLDFAGLCSQHGVSESVFNGGLDYMRSGWPKKDRDNLPSIILKDETSGYYWLKLPPNDKRALILGTITHCCQDITGHSGQCVKDAVSLSGNGLYVLLKPRKDRHTGDASPLTRDEINDKDFDIVGQSYAWVTKTGNLCLDSIECKLDSVSNDLLQIMVRGFAHEVMRQSSEVKRVNVGRGGKTPPGLFESTTIAEEMRQGDLYGDAMTQYIIARTPGISTALLQAALINKPADFCECIDYLSQYTADHDAFMVQLRLLLEEVPSIVRELTAQRLMRLFFTGHVPCLDDLYPIDFHAMALMSLEEQARISTARLIFRANTVEDMLAALPFIRPSDRLAVLKENCSVGQTFLSVATKNAESLLVILSLLPEPSRLSVVYECSVLYTAVFNPELIPAIFSLLPESARLATAKAFVHAAVENAQSLRMILDFIPESERFAAVKEKNTIGKTVLQCAWNRTDSLRMILALYPASDRLAAVKEKAVNGQLVMHFNAHHPDSLHVIFSLLPESDRLAAVKFKDESGFTILHHIARYPKPLGDVLAFLPESDRLAALNEKNASGQSSLQYAFCYFTKSSQVILSLLPESDRLAAVKEKRFYHGEKTLLQAAAEHDKGLLQVILGSLSISHLPTLLCEESLLSLDNKRFDLLKRAVVNRLAGSISAEQMNMILEKEDSQQLQGALKVVLQAKMKEGFSDLRETHTDKSIEPPTLS